MSVSAREIMAWNLWRVGAGWGMVWRRQVGKLWHGKVCWCLVSFGKVWYG